MTKAEMEIKKCYDMRKITKRQHDTMMRHAEHHSFAHVRKMLDDMERGIDILCGSQSGNGFSRKIG